MTIESENIGYVEGAVIVNDIFSIIDEPNVKIWHVDCKTKRPEFYHAFEAEKVLTVTFFATNETLFTNEDKKGEQTHILINLGEDAVNKWNIIIDGGRYDFRIVAYRSE